MAVGGVRVDWVQLAEGWIFNESRVELFLSCVLHEYGIGLVTQALVVMPFNAASTKIKAVC